jgi:hypothetical protein
MSQTGKSQVRINPFRCVFLCVLLFSFTPAVSAAVDLRADFISPPDSARPGVYWYFMDGNMSREGMTADLESMKDAGIGNILFLEVNIGVPRGPVDFMSDAWQDNFVHLVRQAERLGIDVTVGTGPGWTGAGGPWVKPEDSMQHLCARSVQVRGPKPFTDTLPVPDPWAPSPWSGLSGSLADIRNAWYKDVAVLAFPTPDGNRRIDDLQGKAFYLRGPYSSDPGVKLFFPMPAEYPATAAHEAIDPAAVIDLTDRMRPDGSVDWTVPEGEWTVVRFAARSTGQTTRPAPTPGYGFETDKFTKEAVKRHFDAFTGKLLDKLGPRKEGVGWTRLHLDSWEVGAQNWTTGFRAEFQRRRGYDPLPFFPAYQGMLVGSLEKTERFLWDIRKTCQELTLENHAEYYKALSRQVGMEFSIEPYDMNYAGDLDLGAVADVPHCEFWAAGEGFDTVYSCIEAVSAAHVMGRPHVAAEAFTSNPGAGFKLYPGAMKNQTDWAFAMGINGIVFHTFQHQPLGPEHRPGMAMGPYGVHWHRNQTFWPMVSEYHRYISRSSHLLRQGTAVADILYLAPEGAPHIFLPPASAIEGSGPLRDKKGYRFDGVAPTVFVRHAEVAEGRITFAGGTSYRLLVLPNTETMTPQLLAKIKDLVNAGAVVLGSPPKKSPSLSDYPNGDRQVQALAQELWGGLKAPAAVTERAYGKGRLFWGGELSAAADTYPSYEAAAALLRQRGTPEDFTADGPVRFTHRRTEEQDIYFVSNRSDRKLDVEGRFRIEGGTPELWHPVTGEQRRLPDFTVRENTISVPLRFDAFESYFVVFTRNKNAERDRASEKTNFPSPHIAATLDGAWEVSFDPAWGGPEQIAFETLQDWTLHPDDGIKYYSGIATYRKTVDLPAGFRQNDRLTLDLGVVHHMAQVRLNGKDLGVVWTAPWQVALPDGLKPTENVLEIDVANTWVNRLIGDEQPGNKDIRRVQWDNGLLEGRAYPTGRYTFTTDRFYKAAMPLMPSGLLGPVTLQCVETSQH